jgi:3-deoxy-D-manno-octulosonic-acid transferase
VVWLYNVVLWTLLLVGWPYLAVKYAKNSEGWRERLGAYPSLGGRVVWIHVASVGEATAIAPLVSEFRRRAPEFKLFITAFTRTGKVRAKQLYGDIVYYAPLDFSFSVSRACSRVKPEALILTESELWPNLVIRASRRCRLFLINGRMTQRSEKRYRMFGGLLRTALNGFTYLMVQSEEYARRLEALGAPPERVRVTGNIKSDASRDLPDRKWMRGKLGLKRHGKVVVAGSTREGEEEIVLRALAPLKDRLTLILAPRHPERIPKVEQIIESAGFSYAKRSRGSAGGKEILLVDTLGELTSIYAAADIAFVGGSLFPYGGHNPLEAAACGIPVLFGAHMLNAGSAALKQSGGGIEVTDEAELRDVIAYLLDNPEEAARRGSSARKAFDEGKGASRAAFSLILSALDETKDRRTTPV